ncbi:MAG: hypothetical protein J0L97_01440 [Alphaproteobacteria bacterium]|nr:hypothetical protein [Alphaproteobacteria bacterium]
MDFITEEHASPYSRHALNIAAGVLGAPETLRVNVQGRFLVFQFPASEESSFASYQQAFVYMAMMNEAWKSGICYFGAEKDQANGVLRAMLEIPETMDAASVLKLFHSFSESVRSEFAAQQTAAHLSDLTAAQAMPWGREDTKLDVRFRDGVVHSAARISQGGLEALGKECFYRLGQAVERATQWVDRSRQQGSEPGLKL